MNDFEPARAGSNHLPRNGYFCSVAERHMRHFLLRTLVAFASVGVSPFSAGAGVAPSESAEASFVSGEAKLRANDVEGARADFEAAVEQSPRQARYSLALGLAYLRLSKSQRAAEAFGRSCALTETEFGSRSNRLFGCYALWGNALLVSSDFTAAAAQFKNSYQVAFAQDPRSIEDCLVALYFLTRALEGAGQVSAASEFYAQLLSDTPTSSARYPEIEDALKRVRSGEMPQRLLVR